MKSKKTLMTFALCLVVGILASLNGGTPWGP